MSKRLLGCKPPRSNLFLQVLDDWIHPRRGATPIQNQWYRNVWFTFWGPRCGLRWCWRNFHWDGLCGKHWCDEQDWEYAIHLLKERGVTDPDRHTIETMRDKIRKEERRDKDSWWEGFFWGFFWGD